MERTDRGDDTRWFKGFGAGFFTCFNRNRRGLAIDMRTEAGKALGLADDELLDLLRRDVIGLAPPEKEV